jgi:hypothetical protein
MQTAQDDLLPAKIAACPKAVRVWRTSPPDGIAFTPSRGKAAGQHMCHPTATRASISSRSRGFRSVEGGDRSRHIA